MRQIRIDYGDSLREAAATIRGNPLRSSLAALAMAAAVATTAVVVTGLDALAASARLASARAFGSDTFIVARLFPTGLSRRELADKLERNPNIRRTDLRFLERHAGDQVLYAPVAQRQAEVAAGSRTFENATVNGAGAALADIRDVGLERGRFLTREEESRAAQVAILGWSVADTLFPAQDALGASVRIGGRGFTVIGVQTRQGTAGGVSLDRFVFIPFPAFERLYGTPESLQIFARASDVALTSAAENRARASMRARRQLAPGVADNFDVLTPEASRSFVSAISERVGAAGPPISLMALLAAIVVITNTTLVSVTQRTREIGVRRAVGATRGQILLEVITESALVAVAGGSLGVLTAGFVLSAASGAFGSNLSLQPVTMAFSLGAAAASGIAAGWYPARRAASIDVVAALRAE
jgi:putative ABC transport system permease protein